MSRTVEKRLETLQIISHSPEQTHAVGVLIGGLAVTGDLVLLEGELGVGKTCLTQGIARALGIDAYITSPSFVLLREYRGRLPLYHMDLYRLNDVEEVEQLGMDDYLYGEGICVVEWAEKGLAIFPPQHLLIEMHHLSTRKRMLRLIAHGTRYEELLPEIEKAYHASGK